MIYWEKNETPSSSDSDCSTTGTWDYCWFWLLKVNAWGKMIDLHFSKTQDKQVKPKINTTYHVIIALGSCFMWYSKPFKKTVIKFLNKLCYLGALKPAVSEREWLVLLWRIPNEGTSTYTPPLFCVKRAGIRNCFQWTCLEKERMDRIHFTSKIKREFLKWSHLISFFPEMCWRNHLQFIVTECMSIPFLGTDVPI